MTTETDIRMTTETDIHRTDPGADPGYRTAVAAVVTVLCWASAFIGIRHAGRDFGAGSLALLRMAVGTVVLTGIALRKGVRRPPRKAVPLIVVWGVAWFCVYNVALNRAEFTIDAGTAAMIVNLAPLMVILLAGLLLKEGFPHLLLIGAPISFVGVVLIGSQSAHGGAELTGLALALLAAVIYAGCTLLQKRLLAVVDGTTVTWLGAVAGTIALLPWIGQLVGDLGTAAPASILGVIYLGVFPTAIAFTTWSYVLSRSTAGRTAATTYLVPALAIGMSWAVLGEAPTVITLIGGALCLLGVFITRLRP